MDSVRLSVIVPVFNAERTLDRCMNSVLNQEFASYEIILVDDGSTDSSGVMCDRYAQMNEHVVCIHQKNSGVSAARNSGLDRARGEYVMFLDSDDALLPYALDDMFNELTGEDFELGGYAVYSDGHPSEEICPSASLIYRGGEAGYFFQDNIRRNTVMLDSCWGKLFRRELIGDQRFDESLSYAEDKLFVLEYLSKCKSFLTVSSPVYAYYISSGTLGSDRSSDKHLMQLRNFLPKYAGILSILENLYPDVEKVRGLYHNDLVGRYLCRILNICAVRESEIVTQEYLGWVYGMMDKDPSLGIFSLRIGQIPNIILYTLGSPSFSIKAYDKVRRVRKMFCSR